MVASVPELTRRTCSSDGMATDEHSCKLDLASRRSAEARARLSRASAIALTTDGCGVTEEQRVPRIPPCRGSFFPSASITSAPTAPRWMNSGCPPTAFQDRTGLVHAAGNHPARFRVEASPSCAGTPAKRLHPARGASKRRDGKFFPLATASETSPIRGTLRRQLFLAKLIVQFGCTSARTRPRSARALRELGVASKPLGGFEAPRIIGRMRVMNSCGQACA